MRKTKFDIFMPAGGIGRRLGGITKNKPKPLIKIFNKEFIFYVIKSLLKIDIDTLNLMVSYKKDSFKNIKFDKISTKLIVDKRRSGTFNCLYSIKGKINKNFIYSNSDEILDINLNKCIKLFNKTKADVLQLYFINRDGNNLTESFILNKKNLRKNKNYTEAGLKIFSKNIFKIKIKKNYKNIEDFINDNKDRIKIKILIIDNRPFSIDTAKRITRTKKYLKSKIKF